MKRPDVSRGQWIRIAAAEGYADIAGYVFDVFSDGTLSVGYFQNGAKAIKEDVVWEDSSWKFKFSGPNGSYLHGSDAALVRRGPPL